MWDLPEAQCPFVKMTQRRQYLNFTTPHGVDMSVIAKTGPSRLLIHDTGYLPKLEGWNHARVDSPFWRLYFNPESGCYLRFQGAKIPLKQDRLVLIPANTIFDCCQEEISRHFWVHFTVLHHGRIDLEGPQIILADALLMDLIYALMEKHGAPPADLRDQALYHLACAAVHLAFARLPIPLSHRWPERLAEILDLIQHSPHSDLSNHYLASRAGMGLERFIRWFKQHVGQTPASYVSTARIRAARESLVLSDKSIEQIAAECGFPNRHYFTRIFVRQTGCGPAEFRKRQRDRKGL